MPKVGRTSDWEILFEKCEADPEYRGELSAALRDSRLDEAAELLRRIGVAGRDQSELEARIAALKAARDPMWAVETVFGARLVPLC